jgi:flagellar biosynthesis/type III secretory pathway M-ring protein FliF/YscJ
MPALPLHEAGKYVAGAYVVFVALILIYVAIMATRLGRMERDLAELHELADAGARRDDQPGDAAAPEPVAGASR